MTLAGLSPAGALIVRAGEPFALQVGYVDEADALQDLTGRLFALAIRYTDQTVPFLTIDAELDGLAVTAVALGTAEQASLIYAAGLTRSLSYDFMELTGGATASRLTERVAVQPGSDIPGDVVPQYMDLPMLSVTVAAQRKLVVERGRPGFGAERRLYDAGLIDEPTTEKMDERYLQAGAEGARPFADAAEAARNVAIEKSESAQLSAESASGDADRAEMAALQAVIAGPYATIAEGLAATADGEAFTVFGAGNVYATSYVNQAGSAVEIGSYPSKASVDAALVASAALLRTDGAGDRDLPMHRFATAVGAVFALLYGNGLSLPGVALNAPPLGKIVHPDAPAQSSLSPLGCVRFLFDDQGALMPGGARWRGYGDGVKILKRGGGVAFKAKSGEGAQIADWQFREITDAAFRVINPLGCVIYSSATAIAAPDAPDIAPLIGGDLALVSDRRLALHVGSLFKVRRDDAPAIVTIANLSGAYSVTASDGTILLDPARLSGQTTLAIRRKDSGSGISRILTARVKSVPVAGLPAINGLFLGDSITNRQTAQKCNALLAGWGYAPNWIGTINGAGTSDSNDATGPLGEGREGWALSDFLGTKQDADWTSVVAPGAEAAYLALSKANKRLANPFLNPDTGAGSAAPIVTVGGTNYRFDLGHYLSRFSLATPGLFVLNLGMNDMLEEDEATALTQVASGYGYLVDEIRRVAPTAKILIWATTMPRGPYGDLYWSRWANILAAVEQFVRARVAGGDTNIRLCSAWAHQSQEAGWLQTLGAVDAATGFAPYELTEPVHPLNGGRDQHSEPLAAAIANFF
ncbi:SGNH/GDSL hydrolase family protein [Sphingobium sp. AS12]|uniref:SGNH/GDSL hydrolase family protein n=1 Tax=Sphingobium sp. AS12 TaxID=2849495 RepID=UPI001C31E1EE|nr:SGNH/GDSL hydrolase family protein [Sphingobium sp. AS12]MBV2148629.1 SGNH/GDSL hydrolase family protein [Sphingobium sp. AS12]